LAKGTIKSVDLGAQRIQLEDGTRLIVHGSLVFNRSELEPDASVRALYEERAGGKFTTTLTLEPPASR
jgi:hypothetical protein